MPDQLMHAVYTALIVLVPALASLALVWLKTKEAALASVASTAASKETTAAVKEDAAATAAMHADVKVIQEKVNGTQSALLEKISSLERLVAAQAAALAARSTLTEKS